jgi:hypothetical protein
MTKRIEQPRRHGHYDPRWTDRLHLVAENHLSEPDEPVVLTELAVSRLKLVGGSPVEEDAAITATPW